MSIVAQSARDKIKRYLLNLPKLPKATSTTEYRRTDGLVGCGHRLNALVRCGVGCTMAQWVISSLMCLHMLMI